MKNYINHMTYIVIVMSALFSNQVFSGDVDDINIVIEQFNSAIIDVRKEQEFYALFLHDNITWASVPDGKTKEKKQSDEHYNPVYISRFKDFYQGLKKGGQYQENFYNTVIQNDNNHATVSFEYEFLKNDVVQNWGKEYWSLLKVGGSWKITSVLWTMNDQHIEKSPY